MTTILTRAQMQEVDRIAIEDVGIPSMVLMEVAGRAVADVVSVRAPRSVLALAGTGNNGGDAVVVARHLRERGIDVVIAVLGEEAKLSPDARAQLQIAERLGLTAEYLVGRTATMELPALMERHDLLVDGLFGTGLTRPIDGWRAEVIEMVDASHSEIVSVDIPSGIDADSGEVMGVALHADATVTFQFAKFGHLIYPGRAHAGELSVVDIGIPPSRVRAVAPFGEVITERTITLASPPRAPNSHKGTYGHLLVVAGAPDRPGAALLTARAALRAGTGLTTIASEPEVIRRLAPAFDELMGLSIDVSAEAILSALETRTALAIGPSLDLAPSVIEQVLLEARAPIVLDAGALTALGTDLSLLARRSGPTVLTPHPGEMARMLGVDSGAVQRDRLAVARRVAAETGAEVVLKGASTLVASPDGSVGVLLSGNPGMATGGSGDVLTGIVGGLLAQGVEARLAARAGAEIHGRAGDLAASAGQAGLVASDLLGRIPEILP